MAARALYGRCKGNVETGLIWIEAGRQRADYRMRHLLNSGKMIRKPLYKLSASDLQSFVIGRDSFVVAAEPQNQQLAIMALILLKCCWMKT